MRRRPRRKRLAEPLALATVLDASGEHRHSPHPPPVGLNLWARLVGDAIARRSEPRSLRAGVLYVDVTSSSWAQELSLLHDTVLERLRQAGFEVNGLRFRVASLPGKDPGPTTLLYPARKRPVPVHLKHTIESVEDDALREVLTELGSYMADRLR